MLTAEQLALNMRKVEACEAGLKGTATPEQQQLLATIITDLELVIDTILNRVEYLKSLVTTELGESSCSSGSKSSS